MAPSGAAGVCSSPVPVPGMASRGTRRQVGQVGEEAPVGDVLAERDPVDLLEPRHQRPVGPQGHDLVAERRGSTRSRSPRPPAWCGACGPGPTAPPPRVSPTAGVEGHHVLGPQHQLGRGPVVELLQRPGGLHLGGEDHARVDLGLAEAACPAALDGGGRHRGDRWAAVGGVFGTTATAARPATARPPRASTPVPATAPDAGRSPSAPPSPPWRRSGPVRRAAEPAAARVHLGEGARPACRPGRSVTPPRPGRPAPPRRRTRRR